MKRNWLILALLLLAHLSVDGVAFRLAAEQPVGSPGQIAVIALMRSQLSLLALFLAMGTLHWAWRLAALAGGVAAWTAAFMYYDYARLSLASTATLFTLLVVPVVPLGAAARWQGYLWGELPEPSAGLGSRQFSLGAMFRWSTLAAIFFALAKLADFPTIYADLWLRVGLLNTLLALGFLWTLAGAAPRWPKAVALLAIASAGGALLQADAIQAWPTKFALQTLLMLGTAEITRMAGWRLARVGVEKAEV